MLARTTLALLATAAIAATGVSAFAKKEKKPEIKPSVTYPKTWEAAVEEAKHLNVPIVVHSHGFK